MTYNPSNGLPNVFRVYVRKKGAENVVIHEVLSATDLLQHYALRCKVCNTQYSWTLNSNYPFGIDMDFVDNFCESHANCSATSKGPATVLPFKVEQELPEVPTGRKFRREE